MQATCLFEQLGSLIYSFNHRTAINLIRENILYLLVYVPSDRYCRELDYSRVLLSVRVEFPLVRLVSLLAWIEASLKLHEVVREHCIVPYFCCMFSRSWISMDMGIEEILSPPLHSLMSYFLLTLLSILFLLYLNLILNHIINFLINFLIKF